VITGFQQLVLIQTVCYYMFTQLSGTHLSHKNCLGHITTIHMKEKTGSSKPKLILKSIKYSGQRDLIVVCLSCLCRFVVGLLCLCRFVLGLSCFCRFVFNLSCLYRFVVGLSCLCRFVVLVSVCRRFVVLVSVCRACGGLS